MSGKGVDYDSSSGRFISQDPYGGSITDPYSQHGYQYAHGNPVRYTDPTGYFTSLGDAMAAISIASILVSTSASVGYVGVKYVTGEITAQDTYGLFGDWVLSENPVTGDLERKQVLDTFVRHTDRLVDLYIDGEVISTTGEHPFWTPDRG